MYIVIFFVDNKSIGGDVMSKNKKTLPKVDKTPEILNNFKKGYKDNKGISKDIDITFVDASYETFK